MSITMLGSLLVLIVMVLLNVTSERVTYNTDFNWKFKLGNVANEELCPPYPIDLTDMYCSGWAHQAAYAITEDECRLYCCGDPSCAGYTFNAATDWCAISNSLDGCVKVPNSGYVGGGRPVPASVPQPPADGPQSPGYDDLGWETVQVPHDYVVLQPPSPNDEEDHGYRPKNVSWYRKHLTLDDSFRNHLVWVEFDGVYRSCDAWLNGYYLGHHASGYTSFRYRIDNVPGFVIGQGSNVLSLRVDPRANEGWWYEGGGVYRHTRVVRTSYVYVEPWGGVEVRPQVTGIITRQSQGLVADCSLAVRTNVTAVADLPGAKVRLVSTVVGPQPNETVIWTSSSTVVLPNDLVIQTTSLPSAWLWHVTQPHLYTLVTELIDDASEVLLDAVNTTFGFRRVTFDASRGMQLNDEYVKVQGMCNHQDFAGVGTALPWRVNKFRVEKQQSFGVNAWRMSHNPPNPELLDFTDRLGMMVWDENRFLGEYHQWYEDLRDMIRRDRNHPSIIWWSICNEWGCLQYDDNTTVTVGQRFREELLRNDPTRPISGAWDGDMTTGLTWADRVCDVMGINYHYEAYDPFHASRPNKPLVSSESCSCTSDRSFAANLTDAILGPYTAWPCSRDCWVPVASRAFVMGSFHWTGFDYRGEETPTEWPSISSHFGIVDLAGFNKDDMYYSKAWFMPDTPLVHLVPQSWNLASLFPPFDTYIADCKVNYRWVYRNNGSTIESVNRPGYCIRGSTAAAGATLRAPVAPCNASDYTFVFYSGNYGQLYYVDNHGNHICMDVNVVNNGVEVVFDQCDAMANGTAQSWRYSATTQYLQSVWYSPGYCVTFGVPVLVYTNGDQVELFLNGRSLGVQSVATYDAAVYSVQYVSGNLTAVATRDGTTWANETVVTTGSPFALVLEMERPLPGEAIYNDGQDVALLTASAVDLQWRTVRSAEASRVVVTFTVMEGNGRIVGTGNGNPSDHSLEQGNNRTLWNGYARAIVGSTLRSTTDSSDIVVMATAPGYKPAVVIIPTTHMKYDVKVL